MDFPTLPYASTLVDVINTWEQEIGVSPPVMKPEFAGKKNLQTILEICVVATTDCIAEHFQLPADWTRILISALLKHKFGWFPGLLSITCYAT